MIRISAWASAPSSLGATAVSMPFRNSSAASSAPKPRPRPPGLSNRLRFRTTELPSPRCSRTMWLLRQIISAARIVTRVPRAPARSDFAVSVSIGESTGASVTGLARCVPCEVWRRLLLQQQDNRAEADDPYDAGSDHGGWCVQFRAIGHVADYACGGDGERHYCDNPGQSVALAVTPGQPQPDSGHDGAAHGFKCKKSV